MASKFIDILFGDIYLRNAKEYFTFYGVAFTKVFPYEFCQIFRDNCQQVLLNKRNRKIWRRKLESEVERNAVTQKQNTSIVPTVVSTAIQTSFRLKLFCIVIYILYIIIAIFKKPDNYCSPYNLNHKLSSQGDGYRLFAVESYIRNNEDQNRNQKKPLRS